MRISAEWASEGNLKRIFPEYGRRSGIFVNKVLHMIIVCTKRVYVKYAKPGGTAGYQFSLSQQSMFGTGFFIIEKRLSHR